MLTIEWLTVIGAILAYAVRSEHRFTKLETQLKLLTTALCEADFSERKKIVARRVASIVTLLACFCFLGCVSSNTNRHASAYDETTERITLAPDPVNAEAGAALVLSHRDQRVFPTTIERTKIRTRSQDTQPPTGKQLFGQWVGKAGATLLIVGGVLIFLFPSAGLAFLVKRFFAIRAALSETVAGIHLSGVMQRDEKLAEALKAAQTPATRTIVKRLKVDA